VHQLQPQAVEEAMERVLACAVPMCACVCVCV
jgi:hypothetical protein